MGRRIVMMKLICSLGRCECDGYTLHKLSQRRLTADLLAPRESDCSRMHSKVFSDGLPNYIKATRPVLEIFKMAGYFPDSPRKQFRCFLLSFKGNLQLFYHPSPAVAWSALSLVSFAQSLRNISTSPSTW
jgi:hypothetical protein